MGRYGLIEDTSEEDSFDSSLQQQQQASYPRKRTYPVAFPTERQDEIYPYNAVPVAVAVDDDEWKLSSGLTSGVVMECFKTAMGWVGFAVVEYGGKFFAAGILHTLIQ